MIQIEQLNKHHFQKYPVWAWTEDEQSYVPVTITSPLPLDRGPLLVKAELWPPSGPMLEGYVIGLGSVYALGIFVGDSDYVFNAHMTVEAAEIASKLFAEMGIKPFRLFPLRFVTAFSFGDGNKLEGTFDIANRA